MMEDQVLFRSGNLQIEGLYGDNSSDDGVVITHPHPQMGGNMHNNVVDALVSVFYNNGFSTLRFNFRGVGRSAGFYANGKGEEEDVIAAKDFLAKKEKSNIVLAGYSFGAFVNINVFARSDFFSDIILVSPPINIDNLNVSNITIKSGLIICGDKDQFCLSLNLKKLAEKINFRFRIVEGADHFYAGREDAIINHIRDYLADMKIG